MKVDLGLKGEAVSPADYALLKQALIAAQAETPTVRAGHPEAAIDQRDALEQMFDGSTNDLSGAVVLGHRFANTALPQVEGEGNAAPTNKVDR